MTNPLNSVLYRGLQVKFGQVRITNPGDPGRVDYCPDWVQGGRLQAKVTGGEHYAVNCPFCHDTRFRLQFNYRWGVFDPQTRSDMLYLVHCFNEHCISTRERQEELRHMVYPTGSPSVLPSRPSPSVQPVAPIALPEHCVPIDSLPHDCPGSDYLRSRGFDPVELGDRWCVGYSECSSSPSPRFERRIVIPVHGLRRSIGRGKTKIKRTLVGWQARRIDSVSADAPKYLTARGMRKSLHLYGLPQARRTTGPIVICEGVTDVWRLGTNAVALFGKDLSEHQQALVLEHFAGRPLVVFLDDDAQENAAKVRRSLLAARRANGGSGSVVNARTPFDRDDPGDCTRAEVWNQVAAALHCRTDQLGLDWGITPPTKRSAKAASHPRKRTGKP